MTRKERVKMVASAIEKNGFFPMYGGSKGHGFWVYRPLTEGAKKATAEGNGIQFFGGIGERHFECIQNDGTKSGNPYFWMFKDAIAQFAKN